MRYHRSVIAGAIPQLRGAKKITMKSLLSEAEKKEILEKNTEDVTVKTSAAYVLNLMETVHFSYEDAVSALKIPTDLQDAVLEEVKMLS